MKSVINLLLLSLIVVIGLSCQKNTEKSENGVEQHSSKIESRGEEDGSVQNAEYVEESNQITEEKNASSEEDAQVGISYSGNDVVNLSAEVFYQGEILAIPSDQTIIKGLLVVSDGFGEPPLHAFRIADKKFIGSLGALGKGPGEFQAIWNLEHPVGSSEILVFDLVSNRITKIPFTDLESGVMTEGNEIIKLSPEGRPGSPHLLADSVLISIGMFVDGRIGVYDKIDGKNLDFWGTPPTGPANIPVQVRQHAYTGKMTIKPDQSRFAIATRHADQIEIYRGDGVLISKVVGPENFKPVYSMDILEDGTPAMTSGDDMRFGYIDVESSDSHIYGLYSGRTRGEGNAAFGDFIHVLNWEGELQRVYKLDARALNIAYYREDGEDVLFSIHHDPEPAILKYNLTDF